MGETGEKRIFWIDNFQGKPEAVYPFRSTLVESIKKVELMTDEKVVGIIYDGTFTIELLTEKKDNNERK